MYHVHGRKITDDAGKPREQETLMRGLEGGIRKNTASQQFAGCPPYEEFGKAKEAFFTELLGLPNGILPSHDTVGRVFALLDPKQFEAGFVQWIEGISKTVKGVIAIDSRDAAALTRSVKREESVAYG